MSRLDLTQAEAIEALNRVTTDLEKAEAEVARWKERCGGLAEDLGYKTSRASRLESEIAELKRERDEAREQVHHLTYNPHRCNDYPSCKCPAFEACLPMDAEQDD